MDQKRIKADKKKYKAKKTNLKTKNKIFRKLKDLGYPQETNRESLECLYKLISSILILCAGVATIFFLELTINVGMNIISSKLCNFLILESVVMCPRCTGSNDPPKIPSFFLEFILLSYFSSASNNIFLIS